MKYSLYLPQGWSLEFAGIHDPIEAYEAMTRTAQVADELGYEGIWLVDHLHSVQPSQEMLFEAWMSIAALARDTKRIRIGQAVSSNAFRHPALLAKMASTVDVLSHGRLMLGLGAGSAGPEHQAYGYAYPGVPERLRQLGEAVQVIRKMWMEEEATFEGEYYQVRQAINQPKGVQKPHIPLLIGGNGERVTLKLVAQYGDACNVAGDVVTVEQKLVTLKRHCETIERDYQHIYRTAGAVCVIAETDQEALALIPDKMKMMLGSMLHSTLIGSPDTIRRRIAAYEAVGVQELVLRFPDPVQMFEVYAEPTSAQVGNTLPDPLQLNAIRRFAKEFIH